jgi:2-amino-4-hydroxy-6-hydroxymethyldihydropteridine diphosphokinase
MATVYLSLGSNVGDKRSYIQEMTNRLKLLLGPPIKLSRLMETEPVGVPFKQKWFLNRVMSGRFYDSAEELLWLCQSIEKSLGRRGKKMQAPRTADIDILLFGQRVIHKKDLTVPHPRLLRRRFCLEGLRSIAPYKKVPGTGLTITQLCNRMRKGVRSQQIIFPGMPGPILSPEKI